MLTLLLAACGGGGGGGGGGGDGSTDNSTPDATREPLNPRSAESNALFPTSPTLEWGYNQADFTSSFEGTTRIGRDRIHVLLRPDFGLEYYYTDKGKIGLRGFFIPYLTVPNGTFTGDFIFQKNVPLYDRRWEPDTETPFNHTGTLELGEDNKLINTTITGSTTYYGTEPVMLENQQVFDAESIRTIIRIEALLNDQRVRLTLTFHLWFSEDLGIIQRRLDYGPYQTLSQFSDPDEVARGDINVIPYTDDNNHENDDSDFDGIVNADDPDDDNDGIPDAEDLFPRAPYNPDDLDGDGLVNSEDRDDDGDGYYDTNDDHPSDPRYWRNPYISPATPRQLTLRYGSDSIARSYLSVSSNNMPWTLRSETPWVTLSKTSGKSTRSESITATIDYSDLNLGTHTATLVLTNELFDEETTTELSVVLELPEFSLDRRGWSVQVGQDHLHKDSSGFVIIYLQTGNNRYPVTYWYEGPEADALSINGPALLGQGSEIVTVSLDADLYSGGQKSGTLHAAVNVKGEMLYDSTDVFLDGVPHYLTSSVRTVALSAFPGAGTTSREVTIIDSREYQDTRWLASTSAPWLNITAAGTVGDPLVINADATGLAGNQLYRATISITSPDPAVAANESIEVALWVGENAPPSVTEISGNYTHIATDRLRPYVYAKQAGSPHIDIYHIYTGAFVDTLADVASDIGAIAISRDGNELIVNDQSTQTFIAIDLENPALRRQMPQQSIITGQFVTTRSNTKDLLLSSTPRFYDLVTGTPVGAGIAVANSRLYPQITVDSLGSHNCFIEHAPSADYSYIDCYAMDYSASKNQVFSQRSRWIPEQGVFKVLALANDGSVVYAANDSDEGVRLYGTVFNSDRDAFIPTTGLVDAIGVTPANTVKVASDSYGTLQTFSADGVLLNTVQHASEPTNNWTGKLAVSADGSVTVTLPSPTAMRIYWENLGSE